MKYYLSMFIVFKFGIIKMCFVLNFCRLEMVNPDHTTASARARRGQDAAEHRRRGWARGRGVGDVVDEVDTADVQHEDVPGDVGQQTQGGAPPPTA